MGAVLTDTRLRAITEALAFRLAGPLDEELAGYGHEKGDPDASDYRLALHWAQGVLEARENKRKAKSL